MKKPTRKLKVVVSMSGYRIEGFIHTFEGERPSDFLNTQERAFLSLTDAKVYDWQGKFLEDKAFIAINKHRVSWMAEA